MKRAIERHKKGEAHVIRILLCSVDWEDTPFGTLHMLPTNAKPITQWADRDDALADIARGIRRAVNAIITLKRRQHEEEQKRQQAETFIERGKTLNGEKRYAQALPVFERAIQLTPRSSEGWGYLGRTLDAISLPHLNKRSGYRIRRRTIDTILSGEKQHPAE